MTRVPTPTRSYKSRICLLCIRMQPYDTKPPIDDGLLVPWMAYSPCASTSAAAPMGLLGDPAAITCGKPGRSRLISAGGDHAGRRRLLDMNDSPAHCLPARPTPTG